MKNVFLGLSLSAVMFSFNVLAAAKVSYLNVDGDNVHFATAEAKAVASPSCVAAETSERFAVSLRTEAGRAMYSLLITAMSSGQPVTVISGQDCADVFGLERAQSVSISPEVADSSSAGKPLSLYKGDGVTKLGRIVGPGANVNTLYYLPVENEIEIKAYYNKPFLTTKTLYSLYFESQDCSGDSYGSSPNGQTYAKYNGVDGVKMYRYSGSKHFQYQSVSNSNGCRALSATSSQTHYLWVPYVDALCGESACLIKE
ncbi:hypothetical protein SG34_022385 [Thalassomonas viridans]|uniref:Uncharacterized protein n=1 Tax=Thalassomonas viridans TaxID=137584 RepID=A0AAE9Z025_9GAMM|nr:hypothetical protein [Thalassomonas viridans]WDE04083.1 hypothetical protein SG34_022385 [Thalassomonas viridans]